MKLSCVLVMIQETVAACANHVMIELERVTAQASFKHRLSFPLPMSCRAQLETFVKRDWH